MRLGLLFLEFDEGLTTPGAMVTADDEAREDMLSSAREALYTYSKHTDTFLIDLDTDWPGEKATGS
jgi:hypothetical protein